jgi:hypothetical protein
MKELDFKDRFLYPAGTVFAVAVVSWAGYFGSAYLENDALHQALAKVFGATYFLSVAFGTLYVYTVSYVRGASPGERVLASAVTPFIWATKESLLQLEAFGILESLYWYLNPLNFWLVCFMALQMGIGGIVARAVLRRRGEAVTAATPASLALIAVSVAAVVSAYAWGKGENLYVIVLAGYRALFGYGT